MKKLRKAAVIAMTMAIAACFTMNIFTYYAEKPVTALTIIASIKNFSVKKDIIAIGEEVQTELEWSTGAKPQVIYKSSDESVASIDTNGIITGTGEGKAVISVSDISKDHEKTLEITVSAAVTASITYNTSELKLEQKLNKYDTLHYDDLNKGSIAYVITNNGSYTYLHMNENDYVLPFSAEVVGIDGLSIYIAPEYDSGVKYTDIRTLKKGDIIDTSSVLLCYDYRIQEKAGKIRTVPVIIPASYDIYIGEGTIKVNSIDHENKLLVPEIIQVSDELTLPQTKSEFEDFIGQYGKVSVHGKYIVYCDTVNYSTGASVIAEQTGAGKLKEIKNYSINDEPEDDIAVAGAPNDVVYIYQAVTAGQVRLTISQGREWEPEESYKLINTGYYEISDDMAITEIDESYFIPNDNSWLPKTSDQYDEFVEKYGILSVHGKYIVYCGEINHSTNMRIIADQIGEGRIKTVNDYSITPDEPLPPGSPSKNVTVYCAVKAGQLKLIISQVVPAQPDSRIIKCTGFYEISDDMLIKETEEKDFTMTVRGDANGDCNFNIADTVALQKWLTNSRYSEIYFINWEAADFNSDGAINVIDLCLMKKALIDDYSQKVKCSLTVNTTYGGYGVAGQYLGGGEFSNTLTVAEGDLLYESSNGKWSLSQNSSGFYNPEVIVQVISIDEEGVTVRTIDESNFAYNEKYTAVKYGDELKIPSMHIIYDGINYDHQISFSKEN